ncbi:hypothetical protein [Glycomyces salinus]|uniref:hypothetical protein n=1 Tax=Glycomyces salinus TaxID=980294 RepID=UPI0018EC5AA2|nr:hypothetical protein [Glycomyces salinus]
MRFTLTYNGRLPATSNAKTKHHIRRELHPQVKELWRTHPALVGHSTFIESGPDRSDPDSDVGRLLTSIDGNDFASLVHPYLRLHAELDIFVLRPEPPGALITHAGDIDNQIKTLFDALRRPADVNEVPRGWTPDENEEPLHCLLEDDKLITRVNVETDRLLTPGLDSKNVQLTIRVTVKGFTATWANLGMIG